MKQRITLPYDTCPVAEFELNGQPITIKLNMNAIRRAEERLKDRKDVTGHERDGVRLYEAAIEAGMVLDFDAWMENWWSITFQQADALAKGLAAIYNPPASEKPADPPQAPPAQ
jgi:hypothetical protein